jgi:hypothetical protein
MDETRTIVTDVDIPFGRLVMIILKFMLASIPAVLLLYLITFLIIMVFAVVLGGFGALMSGMG